MQTISFLILFLFISGIGTMFGSLVCCYIKRTNRNFAIGLSFSAGIMIYMSLADLLKKSEQVFLNIYSQTKTNWLITILFCISILLSWGGILYAINDPNHLKISGLIVSFLGYILFFITIIIFENNID
jgi:zinc transporter ZupT